LLSKGRGKFEPKGSQFVQVEEPKLFGLNELQSVDRAFGFRPNAWAF